MEDDSNLAVYSSTSVVEYYVESEGLQPCELLVFEKYVGAECAILDLGVGGGRTTPYLSARASKYVGADYSQAMVNACLRKFPGMEFLNVNAANMDAFENESFNLVVFSYNGIDYIDNDEDRAKCLRAVHRILRPGGRFIYSSHNARALAKRPVLEGVTPAQAIRRVLRAGYRSVLLSARHILSGVFWDGEGYFIDPVHGGLMTWTSTPSVIKAELEVAGMQLTEVVPGPFPSIASPALIAWYYYVATKPPKLLSHGDVRYRSGS